MLILSEDRLLNSLREASVAIFMIGRFLTTNMVFGTSFQLNPHRSGAALWLVSRLGFEFGLFVGFDEANAVSRSLRSPRREGVYLGRSVTSGEGLARRSQG